MKRQAARTLPRLLKARLDAYSAETAALRILTDDPDCPDEAWFSQADRVAASMQTVEATARRLKETGRP